MVCTQGIVWPDNSITPTQSWKFLVLTGFRDVGDGAAGKALSYRSLHFLEMLIG